MRRGAERLAELVRVYGPGGALRIAARRLLGREYLVLARDLDGPLPAVPEAHAAFEWRPVGEAELPLLRAVDLAMTEAEVHRRWREGQEGLLCLADGTPAHYRWDAAGPVRIPPLGLTFRPLAGDTYGIDRFTHRAFRGRGIDAVGLITMLHRARERGFRRSLALVPPHNARSLSNARGKAGRVVVGRVGYWGIGPLRHHYATGAVRLESGGFSVRPDAGRPGSAGSRDHPIRSARRRLRPSSER